MANEDMNKLLQMAQEMQNSMKSAHEELQNTEYTGEAGGGLVKVTMNGRYQTRNLNISQEAMADREVLEDLVAAAINATVSQIEKGAEEKMKTLSSAMGMPGDLGGQGSSSGDITGGSDDSGSAGGGKWDKWKD